MNKFLIKEITDLNIWEDFTKTTPQYTIFTSKTYLESFGGKFRLFFIKKGLEIKASLCILLSEDLKDIVLNDLIIYAGFFFKEDLSMKKVKAQSERFELTETIISFLTNTYNKINIALSTKIEDLRPFLWYNYHSNNKDEKFQLNLRYTSYLDISEFEKNLPEYENNLFKSLELIRQRNIKKARNEKCITKKETNIELFLEYYEDLMSKQGISVSKKKIDNMYNIIKNLIQNQQAIMFITKNNENKILYITVFCFDKYRAYYLFGAGNPNAVEKYGGTICFWDAFKYLALDYKIKEIDFEGINSPKRGWFKLSFGGSFIPYYEIKL